MKFTFANLLGVCGILLFANLFVTFCLGVAVSRLCFDVIELQEQLDSAQERSAFNHLLEANEGDV